MEGRAICCDNRRQRQLDAHRDCLPNKRETETGSGNERLSTSFSLTLPQDLNEVVGVRASVFVAYLLLFMRNAREEIWKGKSGSLSPFSLIQVISSLHCLSLQCHPKQARGSRLPDCVSGNWETHSESEWEWRDDRRATIVWLVTCYLFGCHHQRQTSRGRQAKATIDVTVISDRRSCSNDDRKEQASSVAALLM